MSNNDVRVEHRCEKVEDEHVLHKLKKEGDGAIIVGLDFTYFFSERL
jgi:hypothetical protein